MYIVLEIQKNADGQIGTLIYSFDNEPAAYNKYFTCAASAAISTIPLHVVTLMTEVGSVMRNESFRHQTAVAEEVEE
jgi:hypothetical protein